MRLELDADANCAYIYLQENIRAGEASSNFDELVPTDLGADVVIDLDAGGHLLGIEIIGASILLSAPVISLGHEISDSGQNEGSAEAHRWPVYLDASTDILCIPLVEGQWDTATRVLRLPLPEQISGWVKLYIDTEGHLFRIDAGPASQFFNKQVLRHALQK